MTPEQLADYVAVMREHNVHVFKTQDIHIELGPAPVKAHTPAPNAPKKASDYQRLLFAATEGFPEEDDE